MALATERARRAGPLERLPGASFFVVSAVFHYLGPSFAVLLFAGVGPLGVAWLRIATAAAFLAAWRRPWRTLAGATRRDLGRIAALGAVLAVMNAVFYLAIARLPLSTVGAIEFLGPIALAAAGVRTRRNLAALALAVGGVALLTEVRIAGQPLGFVFAFANCALFVLYVVLGHRVANARGAAGIDGLASAMLAALIVITPIGLLQVAPVAHEPWLLLAGCGVGLCSSVIPYVCDQLAMARMRRATFALLLSVLPVTATVIGLLVLRQVPTAGEIAGILLVVAGLAVHREA